MNAASRGVISLFLQNAYFPDRQACLDALADAMRVAYCTFLEAGQAPRLDGPELALSRHMLVTDVSDAGFLTMAAPPVTALEHALDGLPRDNFRPHICWVNDEGPHCCLIDMAVMLPLLMRMPTRYLLSERSYPRHGHE